MITRFVKKGLGLSLALSLFFIMLLPHSVHAFGIYGPQPVDQTSDEKYYYWGSTAEPQYVRNGIDISIDPTSVSYQTIKATVTMDANLITDRDITYFAILANGIYVDFFMPYFDNTQVPPRNNEYYTLDVNITDSMIGSEIYFQVLAVHTNPDVDPVTSEPDGRQFVVGWSAQSGNFVFKPLPVIDRTAIGILDAILAKLEELKAAMESKMDALTQAVEAIYKASPEKSAELDTAIESFMDATPMKQLQDNASNIQDKMEEKRTALNSPADENSELKFGEFEWWPGDPDTKVTVLDLSEWLDQVKLFRKFIQLCLWAWFFHMLFAMLSPRLNI